MMTRYKTNTQTIIIAVIVILLCLVCLTGATLALFTSDAGDGTIGVITTTGRIKVDIIDAETDVSLIGKVLTFKSDLEQEDIYFEPGATYYTRGFRVENDGNIPINYRVYVSEDPNIDVRELERAFDIYIVRESSEGTTTEHLSEFEGHLGPETKSTEVYYLVIKMKADAGNFFQSKEYSGIGITVHAVQGNVDVKDVKE